MTSSVIRKYARALAEVAAEEQRADQVLTELESFQEALTRHKDLFDALVNPAVPFQRKRTIIEQLAPRFSLSRTVVNFILLLIKSDRLKQFRNVVEAYQMALDDQRGVLRGMVYSAAELDNLSRGRLESVLQDQTGKSVRLSYLKDPSLIGGLRVQIGSTVFDGSIRSQLEQIREQLAGE